MSTIHISIGLFLLSTACFVGGWLDCRQNARLERLEQQQQPTPVSQSLEGMPSMAAWCSNTRHWQDWRWEALCIRA